MAVLDGILLFPLGGPNSSGGAFVLKEPAQRDAFVPMAGGWHVEVRRGGQYVVARCSAAATRHEDARDDALRVAQQALDWLSVQQLDDLVIRDSGSEAITWWLEHPLHVLRITAILTIDAAPVGNVVFQAGPNAPLAPPAPQFSWHESYRYYRLGQATGDLFDAYRNSYLALECLLEQLVPQLMRPATGGGAARPGEGEGVWLRRAITHAGTVVNLADFVPLGTAVPADALFNDIYGFVRTGIFHAKTSRQYFLPHDSAQRQTVVDVLDRLKRFYLALARASYQLPGGGAVITREGFQELAHNWEPGFRIHLTDDKAPITAGSTVINPGGGGVVSIPTQPVPALDGPFLKSFLGRSNANALQHLRGVPAKMAQYRCMRPLTNWFQHPLTHVTRVVATLGIVPVAYATLEGALDLEGSGCIEAHVGIRLRNARTPKTAFST